MFPYSQSPLCVHLSRRSMIFPVISHKIWVCPICSVRHLSGIRFLFFLCRSITYHADLKLPSFHTHLNNIIPYVTQLFSHHPCISIAMLLFSSFQPMLLPSNSFFFLQIFLFFLLQIASEFFFVCFRLVSFPFLCYIERVDFTKG